MAPRKGKKGRKCGDSDEDEVRAPSADPLAEAAPASSAAGGRKAKKKAGRRGRAADRESGDESDEPGPEVAAARQPAARRPAVKGTLSFAALQASGDEDEEAEEEELPAASAGLSAFDALNVRLRAFLFSRICSLAVICDHALVAALLLLSTY